MKILSCHIENFGKLHHVDIDFTEGVNIIYEDNGWGKSTFAAFIKAMFYGLDERGGRKKEERKKYLPWQGGVYGGRLRFTVKDRQYEATRTFGSKEAEDVFELRDAVTNLVSGDYSALLGEELFQIDKASFARTAFIAQHDCETGTTDDINAKIGNLADHTDDLNNYDTADEAFKKIMNSLNPNRATGSVNKRKSEITAYERRVLDGEQLITSIDHYQEEFQKAVKSYEQLKEELRAANEEQAAASKVQTAAAKKAEWERLKKGREESRQQLANAQEYFPDKIPEQSETEEQISRCGGLERALERAAAYRLTEAQEKEFAVLTEKFRTGILEKQDIENKLKEANRLNALRQEAAQKQLSGTEAVRLKELKALCREDLEPVSSVIGKWNLRNSKKAALSSNQAALSALKATVSSRKRGGGFLILAAVGICLIAAGLFAAFLFSVTPGICIGAFGAAVLAAGLLLQKNASKEKEAGLPPELLELEQTVAQDDDYIRKTDAEVAAYLSVYGKHFEETMVFEELQEIAGAYQEYQHLRGKEKEAEADGSRAEISRIRAEIAAFLQRYGTQADETGFSEALYKLEADRGNFRTLCAQKKNYDDAVQAAATLKDEICGFLKRYAFLPQENLRSQLDQIREAVNAYHYKKELERNASAELERFEAETEPSLLSLAVPENLPSLEEIAEKVTEITQDMETVHRTMTEDNRQLEELQLKYNDWEDAKQKLEELKEIQENEQQKYRLVAKAREYLEKAKEAMTAKYAEPIMKSFRGYYELITRDTAEKYRMDANISLTVDEWGKQRDVASMSLGYRDLIGICLRTALIDAMYTEEAPVIVMDDPFTNLDDQKQTAAGNFLRQLGKRYQIIYFTCSAARK